MARFSEAELERIKREVDLVELVRRRGIKLRRHGRDWLGLCPFHDDHEPSLVVTPAKGLWHCLGACQAGGTAIDWVMHVDGVAFREAVVKLKRELAVSPPTVSGTRKTRSPSRKPAATRHKSQQQALLARVVAHYHETLSSSQAALGYLDARGLKDGEAIEHCRLGYADGSLAATLAGERDGLTALGVLTGGGEELLVGCVVVPILSVAGEVLNLYGRRIEDTPGGRKHLYLPGPRQGIWNAEGLADTQELILCEALLDALTFWVHGFRSVTASYGVHGFSEDLHQAITRAGLERLLIAYDRDAAGEKAAEALARRLGEEGIGCFRVTFPRGMDANEYACKVKPAKESLALALQAATWMAGPKHRPSETSRSPAAAAPVREPEVAPLVAAPVSPAEAAAAAKEEASSTPAEAAPTGAGVDPLERTFGDRRWRIRGLEKNLSYEKLQVLVRVACGDHFFVDAVDLVAARQRAGFLKQAAVELGAKEEVLRRDLAQRHLELELAQDQLIAQALAGKEEKTPVVSPEAEREALGLLRRPDLLDAILADFSTLGLVGEESNKLLGYLAAVSRLLDRPLAVLVQSSSAAGKSALLEAILSLVPEEHRVAYSGVTGQALFYMGEQDLKHKVLAIAEEEGAERAAYALKLLQSEGELTIASTGKDPATGKLTTHEYRVEGPVAILMTTTAIEVDEELLNRCLVLTVDEEREQTRAIHARQREAETLEGLLAQRERQRILERHRNAQRLLQPLLVANPYARELTFLDDRPRTRRDHVKYLTLIRAIALLHQYQRPKKQVVHAGEVVKYIEVTREDVALANRLASEALGRSLDELPPQTRSFLERLHAWVERELTRHDVERQDFLFSRRSVREALGWSDTQARKHLERLVELEYVLVHGGACGQRYVYELAWDGEGNAGERFLMGLLDIEGLPLEAETLPPEAATSPPSETTSPPQGQEFAPRLPPERPPLAPRSPGGQNRRKPLAVIDLQPLTAPSDPESTTGETSSVEGADA